MTRVVAAVFKHDGVRHVSKVGQLGVPEVGGICLHHRVELADCQRIDLRARMRLGDDPRVPHGIVPADAAQVALRRAVQRVAVLAGRVLGMDRPRHRGLRIRSGYAERTVAAVLLRDAPRVAGADSS